MTLNKLYKPLVISFLLALIDNYIKYIVRINNIQENVIANTSLKRIGKPDEVANTALFLSSEMSNYITGQIIRVDGGM